ncbi:MAG: UDP-glucose 4-epimerase GalE [Actinomycetales bacterium]|nr:UDP-glucose 4-epimerase GalE [Actinomycetales bacterium]
MRVLVTGGAGYIGAHIVRLLQDRGDDVVVFDDLSTGSARRVGDAVLVIGDLTAPTAVNAIAETIRQHNIDAVVHFAAKKQVGESVLNPTMYFRDNILSLCNVLDAMKLTGVDRIVFSSSAAVYGEADGRVFESDPTEPSSPYGDSKLFGERLLSAAVTANSLRAASLRYFNVGGAGWDDLGDTAALNLIPMVFERLDQGLSPRIFGNDYGTPDGTCIRDYVHVLDLAEAHLAVLDFLETADPEHHILNVGTGTGTSVSEIVTEIMAVSGSTLLPEVNERRPGDAEIVIADASKIHGLIGWTTRHTISDIISSAWGAHTAVAAAEISSQRRDIRGPAKPAEEN